MSTLGENIRARAEEFRTRVQVLVRGGGSSSEHSPLLGNLGILKGPLVAEFREKGVMATVRDRIEKFRAPPATPAPPAPSPEVYAEPRVKTY